MTRDEAVSTLRSIAATVDESDQGAAVERLLERVSLREEAAELRAGLVELGAKALLDQRRGAAA